MRFSIKELWLPTMLFVFGMIVTISASLKIKSALDNHRQIEFSWEAHNRNNALKKGIEDGLESVKSVRDLFLSSKHVTKSEFSLFAQALFARYRGIHALEWVSMKMRDASNAEALSTMREFEFPLVYIEPLPKAGLSPGFDYGSYPLYRELMERAGNSGHLTVSGRIKLMREESLQYGFMAIQPVYTHDLPIATEEQRREALQGFAVGLFRIPEIATASVSHLEPRGVEFLVLDETAEPDQRFLDFYVSRLDSHGHAVVDYLEAPEWTLTDTTRVRQTFPVADRIWSITSSPIDTFRSAEGFSNGANIVLIGGTVLTLTMALFVFFTRAGIKARLKMEEELRESEQKLRVLFDQSPDIIMTVDEKDNCLMINHPPEKWYGGIDVPGSAGFFPPKVQQKYKEILKNVLQTGVANELQFSGDDRFCWELRIVPLRMVAGETVAMVILKDVTEQRKLEANTIRNSRLASLGVLAASVAHEINNPNNTIQFNISILLRSWKDILGILTMFQKEHGDFMVGGVPVEQALTGTPRLLESIERSALRIQTIVGNLKHMARPDQGELDHEVDISEVLHTSFSVLQNQIRMLCDDCRMDIMEPLPTVRGNAQQLEQVFINVVLNALQSLPKRSAAVRISAIHEDDGEFVRVIVSDQGLGIPEEDQDKILDPFFTTKGEQGGTGLGLSISYRIIQNHKGKMVLNSTPGKGTDVIMRLPVFFGNH